MFEGQYQHTIDEKGRLTLPSKFRAILETGVKITRGLDGCLFAFPKEEWEQLAAKLSALSVGDIKARRAARFFFSGASDGVPDKQGRIMLPPHLREHAGLDGEAVIAGVGSRFEIWNTETWQKIMAETETEIGKTSQELAIANLF